MDGRFLHYLLLGPQVQNGMQALAAGSTVPHLNVKDVRSLELPELPSRSEQRRIAAVLGGLDDKIEHNRVLAERLERLAVLEFQRRFAQVRKRVPLSEQVRLWKDSVNPSDQPDMSFEHFSIPAFDSGRLPSLERGDQIHSSKIALPDSRCVLVSKLNPATKRVWWPRPSGSGKPACSSEFLCLVPRDGVPPSFIYASFVADDALYSELLSHVTGTTGSRQRVKPSEVLSCGIASASAEELGEWEAFAGPTYELAAAKLRENARLSEARDALLPKLVSGAIRVPESYKP